MARLIAEEEAPWAAHALPHATLATEGLPKRPASRMAAGVLWRAAVT